MSALKAYRDRPIPDLEQARLRRVGYRTHAIDTNHALHEEPLVDLVALGIDGQNHFATVDNPPYHQIFPGAVDRLLLRRTVAEKLASIDLWLRNEGLKLFVHDAWRPNAVQEYAHDVWMPAKLQAADPSLSGEALVAAVEQYWARPTSDPASPAPHKTGGAVDLTLAYVASGQTLFMGTIFDDVSAAAHTGAFEARGASDSYSDREAIANRRLLYWLMTEAGFANQPFEWWHYSWGDQMWARLTGQEKAIYGPAEQA